MAKQTSKTPKKTEHADPLDLAYDISMAKIKSRNKPVKKKTTAKKSPVKKKTTAKKSPVKKKPVVKKKGISPSELAYSVAKACVECVESAKNERTDVEAAFAAVDAADEILTPEKERVDISYKRTFEYEGDPSKITLMPFCMAYVHLDDIIYDSAGIWDKKSSRVSLDRAARVMKTFLKTKSPDNSREEMWDDCEGFVFYDVRDVSCIIDNIQEQMEDMRWRSSFDKVTREEMDILKDRVDNIPLHIYIVVGSHPNQRSHAVDIELWEKLCKEQPSRLLNRLAKPIAEMKFNRSPCDVAFDHSRTN